MAHIPINFGGGSGSGSDDCTAGREHVLQNYTAITSESDDEPAEGTMPDKTGWSYSNLEAGKFVLVPKGYHDGTDKVTAKDLASQTSANAVAGHIKSGETAWVNGNKITGSMSVSSVLSFSVAAYSTSQLTFTWKNPAQASGRPFSGVIICCKTGSYPTSPTDGYKYMGIGSTSAANAVSSMTLGGFAAGTTYYCRIWAYCLCSAGNYTVNGQKVLVSGYRESTAATGSHGTKTFTGSGTFIVPNGVRSIDVFCVGGGRGANTSGDVNGGGGGYTATKKAVTVTPGEQYVVTIGAGSTDVKASGGNTSFGNVLSAAGGKGGGTSTGSYKEIQGAGGSGGGSSMVDGKNSAMFGHTGGSDGGNAGNYTEHTSDKGYHAAPGQGTTTRAFGESSGTLYSGGGGGGGTIYTGGGLAGGAGGGGRGGYASYKESEYGKSYNATAGTANTGGGGGGGSKTETSYDSMVYTYAAAGGSGICIVRW